MGAAFPTVPTQINPCLTVTKPIRISITESLETMNESGGIAQTQYSSYSTDELT